MPIGCGNEDDCLSLRDGRWGRVVGVRVTHVVAGVWAVVLLAAAWLASGVAEEWRLALWNLLAVSVLVAAVAGGWFILLQAIVSAGVLPVQSHPRPERSRASLEQSRRSDVG